MPNRRTTAGDVAVSLPFLGGLTVLPAGAQTPAVTAPAAPTMISHQVDIKATIRVRPAGSTSSGAERSRASRSRPGSSGPAPA